MSAALVALAAVPGCARPPAGEPVSPVAAERVAPSPAATSARSRSAVGYPPELVAGPEPRSPGLYLGPEAGSAAIGYVSEGVVLEIAGAPDSGRIPVRIRGGMRVRGWFPTDRLEARVQRGGRVDGSAIYVAPNDVLGVLGPEDAATMRVEARVPLREGGPESPRFTGTFPTDALGGRRVEVAPEAAPGVLHGSPPGAALALYDRPGGALVFTVPPMHPPAFVWLAGEQDGWHEALVGAGPYLAGYVRGTLAPSPEPSPEPSPTPPERPRASAPPGVVPRRLREEETFPLFRVPSGTRVRFDGVTIAVLDRDGFAREMARYDSTHEVDVFVAVDDDVAVRGMVTADALSGASAGARAAR